MFISYFKGSRLFITFGMNPTPLGVIYSFLQKLNRTKISVIGDILQNYLFSSCLVKMMKLLCVCELFVVKF